MSGEKINSSLFVLGPWVDYCDEKLGRSRCDFFGLSCDGLPNGSTDSAKLMTEEKPSEKSDRKVSAGARRGWTEKHTDFSGLGTVEERNVHPVGGAATSRVGTEVSEMV